MRKHQKRIDEISREIIAGLWPKKSITLDCTPGGGKTGAGTLLANNLITAGIVDRVLWLTPRVSLAEQVRDAFASGFGSHGSRQLVVADEAADLYAEDLFLYGHVTTYQKVAGDKQHLHFRDAVKARRTLLILDEVQFLRDEPEDGLTERCAGWSDRVKAIKDAAAFILLMSGTLWRTDDKRIPFVDYERRDGRCYPVCDVSYSLRDAVGERAILPTEWRTRGGKAEYVYNGELQTHDLLDDGEDEESRKVRTMLWTDDFCCGLLDDMVCDWREWKERKYSSRMIVMAENTARARRWRDHLQTKHRIPCVLATIAEEAAGRNLRYFREGRTGQCLVTVAMAYVGFDCPDLTHLAYLSPTRAPSWLLQSFARVSRNDQRAPLDYDAQHAFVYAPDDHRLRVFFGWLRAQQEMGLRDRRSVRPAPGPGDDSGPDLSPPDEFEPIRGTLGSQAIESLARRLDPAVAAKLDEFVSHCPSAATLPKSQLYEILHQAGYAFSVGRPSS